MKKYIALFASAAFAAAAAHAEGPRTTAAPATAPDLLSAPKPPPPAAENASAEDLLAALAQHSRMAAHIENGRLQGEGAEFLRALAATHDFVIVGEDHGSEGIAAFVRAYWADLAAAGYRHFAVETDPYVAAALETSLRDGGVEAWAQFLADHGGADAAPFFNWAGETAIAEAVVASASPSKGPAIWGLDQVYFGSVAWILRDIAENARSAAAREAASKLAADAALTRDWIGTVGETPLAELRALLAGRADRAYARTVDDIIASHRIYRPFLGGDGEAYLANIARETMMKRAFARHYRNALRAGAHPKVLLKAGAYHAHRGATPTHVQGLGGFVTEFGLTQGAETLTILMLCGPGSSIADGSGVIPCTDWFNKTWAPLAPYVEHGGYAIFDLRSWRMRPKRWASLPDDIRRQIDSFDLAIVVSDAPPAVLLPGLQPSAKE